MLTVEIKVLLRKDTFCSHRPIYTHTHGNVDEEGGQKSDSCRWLCQGYPTGESLSCWTYQTFRRTYDYRQNSISIMPCFPKISALFDKTSKPCLLHMNQSCAFNALCQPRGRPFSDSQSQCKAISADVISWMLSHQLRLHYTDGSAPELAKQDIVLTSRDL